MNCNTRSNRFTSALACSVLALGLIFPLASHTDLGLIAKAHAAQGEQSGAHGAGGKGSGGGKGKGSESGHKGGKSTSEIMEADDDSDRPAWAGGNTEENPHSGGGQAGGGGKTDKGDLYSDLWLYLRDPVTGEPLVYTNETHPDCPDTCYALVVCTDESCTSRTVAFLSTAPDSELPAGVFPIEVDLGRLNIGRAPSKVLDHAEDEAISKITADGAVLALDPAGRVTVDGATIDSPLENLALYIAIMTGDASVLSALQPVLDETGVTELQLAAAMLAAGADKTGDIIVEGSWYVYADLVWYVNQIYGISTEAQPYDYSEFVYDRSYYDVEVPYNYYDEDGVTVLNANVNLKDYLDAITVFGDWTGLFLFATAADDAVEIVELLHTQIQDSVLPGTVE